MLRDNRQEREKHRQTDTHTHTKSDYKKTYALITVEEGRVSVAVTHGTLNTSLTRTHSLSEAGRPYLVQIIHALSAVLDY